MDDLFNGLTVTDVDRDSYRNIVSLRSSEHLFDDLSDDAAAWQVATELELACKPHTYTAVQPVITRPFEEADYNNAIGYPFQHWSSTRYSRGTFGVWYGADSLATTIYETVYHWRSRLLKDAGWQDREGVVIERKVFLVRCKALLLDFREKVAAHPALVDPDSYHLTQPVGERIHHDGHPGLITRSARCAGDIVAIFRQQVLSRPRHACYLTYRIEGGLTVVERQPGRQLMRI